MENRINKIASEHNAVAVFREWHFGAYYKHFINLALGTVGPVLPKKFC